MTELHCVGPFIFGKTLGQGTTGLVKLGFHRDNGFKVAIKVIKKESISSNPVLFKKVEREIAVLKVLNHPNVMKLYEVYETEEYLFFITEYIDGGELFDYIIDKGCLSAREALHFFQMLIEGVEYCHTHNICHRDIKPENILLDSNTHEIKICDFGMAAVLKPNTLLATSCGSPHYASPEIVMGLRYRGELTDIWSCGVVLYALVCGKLPFDDDNIRVLLRKVKLGFYTTPPFISRDIQNLIAKMLVVDPNKRISIQEVKQSVYYLSNKNKIFPPITPWDDVDEPIKDIDEEVVSTLEALTFGTKKDIEYQLSEEPSNVCKQFYMQLKAAKDGQETIQYSIESNTIIKRTRSNTTSIRPSLTLSDNDFRNKNSPRKIPSSKQSIFPITPLMRSTSKLHEKRSSDSPLKRSTDVGANMLEKTTLNIINRPVSRSHAPQVDMNIIDSNEAKVESIEPINQSQKKSSISPQSQTHIRSTASPTLSVQSQSRDRSPSSPNRLRVSSTAVPTPPSLLAPTGNNSTNTSVYSTTIKSKLFGLIRPTRRASVSVHENFDESKDNVIPSFFSAKKKNERSSSTSLNPEESQSVIVTSKTPAKKSFWSSFFTSKKKSKPKQEEREIPKRRNSELLEINTPLGSDELNQSNSSRKEIDSLEKKVVKSSRSRSHKRLHKQSTKNWEENIEKGPSRGFITKLSMIDLTSEIERTLDSLGVFYKWNDEKEHYESKYYAVNGKEVAQFYIRIEKTNTHQRIFEFVFGGEGEETKEFLDLVNMFNFELNIECKPKKKKKEKDRKEKEEKEKETANESNGEISSSQSVSGVSVDVSPDVSSDPIETN